MTVGTNRPAILGVLDEISQWRAQADDERQRALQEVEREEETQRRAIEEAQRRLGALAALRIELDEKQIQVGAECHRREHRALRQGLAADQALLTERAARVLAATEARVAEIERRLAEPDLAAEVAEYETFDAEAVAALPPGYRKAILAHHEEVRRRVDPLLAQLNAGPPAVEAEPAGICVLFATDPPEGPPEALVAVLPVPFAVYRDWAERPEDLCATLAYRVMAAVSRVLNAVDAATAPVQCLEVHGCLAIQVWLGDVEIRGELRERTLEEIEALREEAAELVAAKVELYGLWVRPGLLVEEEEE